jgi:hypothetical protein
MAEGAVVGDGGGVDGAGVSGVVVDAGGGVEVGDGESSTTSIEEVEAG